MSAADYNDQPLSSVQDDTDSVEIDDDFYIVENNSINVSVDTSVIDSLTSSDFSLGSDTKDAEEDKGSDESQNNTDMDSRGSRDESVPKGKSNKHGNKSGPHVNPAFEDDDGFVVVDDDDSEKNNERTVRETIPERIANKMTDQKGAVEMVSLQKTVHVTTEANEGQFNVQSAMRHAPQLGHLRASENLRKERESGDEEEDVCDNKGGNASRKQKTIHASANTDSSSSQKTVTVSQRSTHDSTSTEIPAVSSSPKHVFVEHVVRVQPLSRTRRLGDHESKLSRPVSRSVSSAMPRPELRPDDSDIKASLSVFQPVSRSQSLRVPGTTDSTDGPTKGKSRKLLRDLSFSDADAKTVRNYGALRGGQAFPRRKPPRQTDKENSGEYGEGTQIKITPELKSHMLTLMQELLERGKVHQVAVLEQDGSTMVESLPKWTLTHSDELGLVKAVTCTQQNMVKLPVGDEMYTFFKHGQNKMMGRSGDNVLVAEKTNAYVVVGVAVDDTPGSCLYEVSELAQTLIDKGW